MQVGWVKIGDFRQISGYISKTVKDRHIVSIKIEREVVCARVTGELRNFIHNSTVVGLFMTPETMGLGRVMVECTLSITHCLQLNLQLHTIDLVRTCRISSFCTVAWQLARFQLTRRIARSLSDS